MKRSTRPPGTSPRTKGARPNLRRHLAHFESEEHLRLTIASLLSKLDNHKNVQIAHGPLEKGKDIIFSITGGFGNTEHCACVVKNTPISADHTKKGRISDVLSQTKQAFGSPFLDANAHTAFISKCFVICPHEISQVTLTIIKEELREFGERVTIIDGPRLFTLLQDHYPDYKSAEFEYAAGELNRLREQVREDKPLEKLAFGSLQTEVSRDAHMVYVKPTFEVVVHEWAVNSVPLLAGLSPELPEVFRARAVDNKLPKLLSTGFYSTSADYASRVASAMETFQNRIDIFVELDLLARSLADPVTAAYQELISCFETAASAGVSRTNLKRLQNEYAERLVMPVREFVVIGHDEMLRMTERIQALMKALRAAVDQIDTRFVEVFPVGASINSSDLANAVYLSDHFLYRPTPYVSEKQVRRIAVTERSICEPGDATLIVGPAGHGKTSFCRWHTLQDDKLFSDGTHNWIAVYIPLHRLTVDEIGSLTRTIKGYASTIGRMFGRSAAVRGVRYRVYLDGLDEVDDESSRSRIIGFVKERKQLDAPTAYVLTTRDYLLSAETQGIARLHLCPLTDAGIAELALLWLKEPEKVSDFLRQLDENGALKELTRIPLLGTLTILVYRNTSTLPESRLKLYETFIELLCSGWDLAKGVKRRSSLKSEFKALILRKVALLTHLERKKTFQHSEFNQAVSGLDLRLSVDNIEALIDELLADGLIHRSGEFFEFKHLSLQEYLAALEMFCDPFKETANGCLTLFLDDDQWWRDVMGFYVLLIRDPLGAVRWIQVQMKSRKTKNKNAVKNGDYLKRLVGKGISGLQC